MVAFNLGGAASPSPKSKGGHGVFGFVKNLGTDIEKSVEGMPMGVVNLATHPVRSLEAIGKSTWHDWSPLFKGHPMTFLHQTYEHPLAPLLDAVSVATLGAGSAGRVGAALADAGAISDTSKLARLGAGYGKDASAVRDIAHTGPRGTVHEHFAANPLTRAIQHTTRGAADRVMPNWGGGKYARLIKRDEAMRGVAKSHVQADVHAAMKSIFNAGKALTVHPQEAYDAISGAMHRNLGRMARHTTLENLTVTHSATKFAGPNALEQAANKEALAARTARESVRAQAEQAPILREQLAKANEDLAKLHREGHTVEGGAKFKRKNPTQQQLMEYEGRMRVEAEAKIAKLQAKYEKAAKAEQQFMHHQQRGAKAAVQQAEAAAERARLEANPGGADVFHAPEGVAFVPKDSPAEPTITSIHDVDKALKNWGQRHTVKSGTADQLVLDKHGVPVVVPTHTVNLLLDEAKGSSKFTRAVYHNPTRIWKQIALTTPRFFVNNSVGNVAMALNKANPLAFARGTLDAIREVHGNRVALKSANALDHVTQKAVGRASDVIDKWYLGPHKEGFGYEAMQTRHLYQRLEKNGYNPALVKTVKAGTTGIFDITHRIAEKGIRRAGIDGMLRSSPEVKALMKDGKSFSEAVDTVSADPAFRSRMQHQMDNVLGQYHYYNGLEQHLRTLIPFYSWDRAIMRHAKSLALENPARTAAEARLGDQGVNTTEQKLGAIPSFMRNLIPLGGGKVLSTQGFNPYQSVADTVEPALATVGLSDQSPGEALSMQLNPYLAGLMETVTGQSLLSGKKLPPTHGGIAGGLLQNVLQGLPEAGLVQDVAGGTPKPKSGKPFLYSKDPVAQLLALAGVPIKKVNQQRAAELAKAETHVVHHRKKAAKAFTL